MKFHLRTLELFGQPDLPLDPGRGAAVGRAAAALGVELPTAVAEWYTVPVGSDLWRRWYAGINAPAVWRESATGCMVAPSGDDSYREWEVNPPVRRDSRGWVTRPILPLMCEHQGAWEWGVALDGTADPPAVISYDQGDTWDFCCESFSAYVYATVFDQGLSDPAGVGRDVGFTALSPTHRRALRAEFQPGPTTRGGYEEHEFAARFSRRGQRVRVAEAGGRASSRWRVWAADSAGFVDLVAWLERLLPGLGRLIGGRVADEEILLRSPDDGEIPF